MPATDLYKGRRRRVSGTSGSVGTNGAVGLDFDPTRVLWAITVTINALDIIVGDPNATTVQRIRIPVGIAPVVFDVESWGDLVTGRVNFKSATSTAAYEILIVQDTTYNAQTDGDSDRPDLYRSGGR